MGVVGLQRGENAGRERKGERRHRGPARRTAVSRGQKEGERATGAEKQCLRGGSRIHLLDPQL